MNYAKYIDVDVVNGPGVRCTLFVSGCELNCRGCYNRSIRNLNSGHPFTEQMTDKIIDDLNDSRIERQGISLLGGDPLHPANVSDVLQLVKQIRARAPGKDIWCWTGYELANLTAEQQALAEAVDVLIDGPFIEELADPALKWRGSSNQQIHHFTHC